MIVQKCCCCISLKYGFYTWAIINLLTRICCASLAHFGKFSIVTNHNLELSSNMLSGFVFGWFLGSALIVFVALKGIVEKRYMLIYPYIVILIVEVILFLGVTIYLSVVSRPWHFISFFVVGSINTYTIICLISLYQHVKQLEKSQRQIENPPFKSV